MMSLWMAMVGAVATTDLTQEDDCFVQVAAIRSQSLAIPDFNTLEFTLSELVWDEKSLGQKSRSVWNQVRSLRHP